MPAGNVENVFLRFFLLPFTFTRYSTNSPFSEFFNEFSRFMLGLRETIWRLLATQFGSFCEDFEGKTTKKKQNKTGIDLNGFF